MPVPNQAMREEAKRGLEWRKEYGRGGTEVGVARARDISNGANLSMDTVRRMSSYFARHEVDKEAEGFSPGEDGYPSAGRIAWALWGGDPGQSWVRGILAKEDDRMSDQAGEARHIKNIEETETEVIITFGKSEEISAPDAEEIDEAGYNKDKDKDRREARVSQNFEVRANDSGEIVVEGYAAVFNEETTIGGQWREQIAPGAFTDAIGRDDVVFLINHEGLPLARTRSGTLQLSEDDHGLKMRASLDLSDPDVRSIVPKMKRGDLDKMSFAFVPTRQEWDDSRDMPRRTIQQADLYDVSIVTTPAYAGTEIGLRSLEQFRETQRKTQAPRRMRMKARLQR